MGLVSTMFSKRVSPGSGDPALLALFGGRETASGMTITPDLALGVAAVYSAVRIIAETMASLPLHLYRRLPTGGKERATDHPQYPILHDRPNPEQTSFEWRETMMGHLCLRGNAFSIIQRSNAGQVLALWPISPDRVFVQRLAGKLIYRVRMPASVYDLSLPVESQQIMELVFFEEEMLHIRGLSSNGIVGYSPLMIAREVIGMAAAAQEYYARFYKNNANPGGIIELEKKISDPAYKRMKASWTESHQGADNAHKVAILEEGAKWKQLGLTPQDAQFLEGRKFSVIEIARIFRLPPHKLMDLERGTFSNIEQQSIEFVTDTVRPWAVRLEQRLNLALVAPSEQRTYFYEFLLDGILRGDWKSRSDALHIMRIDGVINADEWREIETLNPLPNGLGQDYWIPVNVQAAGQAPADSSEGDITANSAGNNGHHKRELTHA